MNKKGFTLVELLAVIIILGIVVGITYVSVNANVGNAKKKTEEIFIKTLRDAVSVYIDSDASKLSYSSVACTISKDGKNVNLYRGSNISFRDIVNSTFHPLAEEDLVNPANEKTCNASAMAVSIFRDSDYVYYYKIDKSSLDCFETTGYITNLPSGSGC